MIRDGWALGNPCPHPPQSPAAVASLESPHVPYRRIRSGLASLAAVALTAAVAGCGSDSGDSTSTGSQGSAISAERCTENMAAGKITYRYVPATVRAMMVKAGGKWDALKLVKQGYDPSVLPRRQGGLEALTGFVSNEPNQLKSAGEDVTVWKPIDYGVPSSLGALWR